VTALGLPDSYYEGLGALYAGKRELFLGYLERAGLGYVKPDGAYYAMVDIRNFGAESDAAFCEWMAREAGLAAVPGSSFFQESVRDFVRFHFAKRDETLRAAGERILGLRAAWDRARSAGTAPVA